MTATISNWGNSQGIRLSKEIIKNMSLAIGDKVNVLVKNHKIIIEPIKKKKEFDIHELVAKMPSNYVASEEIDDSVGKEIW
ncbi:MAG: AbrB/MazE/SpoVT family DNA-binding domain-containing protein [Sulfurimonas sp.]|nr:AbrB/MazE/SpoVT family DNA-binding domain-containing protein [Sulfurimonas sp.]